MTMMRDDHDLERLLRRTLTARADSVDRPAPWSAEDDDRLPTPRRWAAPLVAAVAAVTVAGVVLGIQQVSTRHHPSPPEGSGTPTRVVSPDPSPTPSPTAPKVALHSTCATRLPSAWTSAIAAGTTTAGATAAFPLFAASDGQVLVSRDFGSSRDVALVAPSGSTHSIYAVPSPEENQVLSGVVEGHWALVTVSRQPRNSNGVLPSVVRVVVIDLRNGAQRTIASADAITGGRTIDGATLYRGQVYYDVRRSYVSATSAIHRYDIADGSDRVVGSSDRDGPARGPTLVAQGVVWSTDGMQVGVPRPLPRPVRDELAAGRVMAGNLSSDGSGYAWSRSQQVFGYWRPGMSEPSYFQIDGRDQHFVLGVAGRMVLLEGDTAQVGVLAVDTRTGATAGLAGLEPFGVQANGRLAYYAFTAAFKTSPTAVVRVDTARLPELKC